MYRPWFFEAPQRKRIKCPDCLEPSLSLSEAEVTIGENQSVGLTYSATCASCGFTVRRDATYGLPLVPVINSLVMLDMRRIPAQ